MRKLWRRARRRNGRPYSLIVHRRYTKRPVLHISKSFCHRSTLPTWVDDFLWLTARRPRSIRGWRSGWRRMQVKVDRQATSRQSDHPSWVKLLPLDGTPSPIPRRSQKVNNCVHPMGWARRSRRASDRCLRSFTSRRSGTTRVEPVCLVRHNSSPRDHSLRPESALACTPWESVDLTEGLHPSRIMMARHTLSQD